MTKSPAQFAIRTMRALEVLVFMPTTAPRVAGELGVHDRTARRLLSQMRRDGWVASTAGPPRVYGPTLRLVALAAHVATRSPFATLTAEAVERLHEQTGLHAALSIPAYDATVCLVRDVGGGAGIAPPTSLAPAHCTAAGKVLLAHRDTWRDAVLALPLVACTQRTSVDVDALAQELAGIRVSGYGTSDREHLDDAQQLAAPVWGPSGEVLAAVGVTARAGLLPAADDLIAAVRDAGRDATKRLAAGAELYPLHRGVVHRLLASYGLAPVDAYI